MPDEVDFDPNVDRLSEQLRFAGVLARATNTGDLLGELLTEYGDEYSPQELAKMAYPYLLLNKVKLKSEQKEEGPLLAFIRCIVQNLR